MESLLTLENVAALLTLTVMEIVLGIDNIVFIAIVSQKAEPAKQNLARRVGLGLAMLVRVAMLMTITWIMGLSEPIVTLFDFALSWRDLILIVGGGFLIYKAVHEIHDKLEGAGHTIKQPKDGHRVGASFAAVVGQIVALDVVFSIDSVLTAIGMVNVGGKAVEAAGHAAEVAGEAAASGAGAGRPMWVALTIMILAVVIAIGVMMFAASPVSRFIERHPTTKMLALAFLLMIGVVLCAEGLHQHISKGYIYSAMVFAVFVEALNLRVGAIRKSAA